MDEEGKPRRAAAVAGIRIIVFIKYAPADVLIDRNTKGIGNLLGNSRAAELWITALNLDDGLDELLGWSLGNRFAATRRRIEKMIFMFDESCVE